MTVLDVGAEVVLLRFLPDGWRLVVGLLGSDDLVRLEIVAVGDGKRTPVEVPAIAPGQLWSLTYRNWLAAHPSGDWAYVAWDGKVRSFTTANGRERPFPDDCQGQYALFEPSATHICVIDQSDPVRYTAASVAVSQTEEKLDNRVRLPESAQFVLGNLQDGSGLLTVERAGRLCVRPTLNGEPVVSVRYPSHHVVHPRISPDGRFVGIIGCHSMYVYDLPTPGKPRRISGSRSSGDFYGFAFHPNGRSIAVIHGGPTLVKEYTLPDLTPLRKRNWKVGPLRAIDYSPDGTMGAAGGRDGRIVVWDADD